MKKTININNHINEILFRSNYRINESPKYHQVIGDDEEFDEFPSEISEDNEEIPPIKPPTEPIDPSQSPEAPIQSTDPNPAMDVDPNNMSDMPIDFDPNNPTGDNFIDNEPTVNDIQNEIIKDNIETMKYIHNQMKELDNYMKNIDTKLTVLSSEVEEVRAPTNGEKLMKQKNVSYPYHYNLNDYWGNSPVEEKENFGQGIKKMDDGTFIADFDDLRKNMNIDKTFNEY
jgi:hypothetical protein